MEVEIGNKEDFLEGQGTLVEKEGKKIAVFNQQGKLFAIDNTCIHKGGSLSDGFLEGNNVTCPLHAWQFNIEDGKCLVDPEAKIAVYNVIEKDDKVFLEL